MTPQQFLEITEWQRKTFPKANSLSKIAHLAEELQELVIDLRSNNSERRLEWADCFLLLFGAAAADDMTHEEICDAIDEKMKINYTSKWGTPNEDGVVNHIKEGNK